MEGSIEAQKNQIKQYFAACQPVFERVITELAIRQPSAPWDFLSEAFARLTAAEKADWMRNLNPKPSSGEASDATIRAVLNVDEVHATQRFTLKDSSDLKSNKAAVVSALNETRTYALENLKECVRFEVLQQANTAHILVLQTWASASAFERFVASEAARKLIGPITPLLASPPDTQRYQRAA